MENYIVYVGFTLKSEDIESAEKEAVKIVDTWKDKPDDVSVTVRGTSL
jgi:hypothetical protein